MAAYNRPKVIGPFPGLCASGSYQMTLDNLCANWQLSWVIGAVRNVDAFEWTVNVKLVVPVDDDTVRHEATPPRRQ